MFLVVPPKNVPFNGSENGSKNANDVATRSYGVSTSINGQYHMPTLNLIVEFFQKLQRNYQGVRT
jgi:hypothetical protein